MNIGLKFRDSMAGQLGHVVREELDQLVASIVQHWLVGHNIDGSHSNAIGADAGDPTGLRYLRDDMVWVEPSFASTNEAETVTATWTFSVLPVLGTLTGYIIGTGGALSASATIPTTDLSGTIATAQIADDAVTNAKAANMAQDTIKLRYTASTGDPQDAKISDLTTNATPGAGDYFIMETAGGNLRKVNWSTLPGASAGEANTASNQGVGGVGLYDTKVGVDLQFRNINAASSKVTVTLDAPNKEVDLDIAEANITISNLGGTIGHAQLAAGGGTATKYLRDDMSWQVVSGGSGLTHPEVMNRVMWGGL